MNEIAGEGNFILEKASIDELYLDLTKACDNYSRTNQLPPPIPDDTNFKVINGNIEMNGNGEMNDEGRSSSRSRSTQPQTPTPLRLAYAAHIIESVRRAVKSKVGYTMSAGISKNKTMAKLTASFCKPNGLSVLTPSGVDTMLKTTKMRKVRNFGGKLGKKVLEVVMNVRGGWILRSTRGLR